MMPGLISILGDNDLSHHIQEILTQSKQIPALYELQLLTTSRYHYFPQKLLPAALAGLISIDEFCSTADWYRQRNIRRIHTPFYVVHNEAATDRQCCIDCRNSGVRILYHASAATTDDQLITQADDIASLIPQLMSSRRIGVRSTCAYAIQLAFALHKAGREIVFVTDTPWIDPRMDAEIQQAISACITRQGIRMSAGARPYPQLSVQEDSGEFHIQGEPSLCARVINQLQDLHDSQPLHIITIGNTPCHYLLPTDDLAQLDVLSMSSSRDGLIRKAWLDDNQIRGFVFLGDVAGSKVMHNLIKNRTDVSAIRHQLLFSAF